ncbi:MULTISPECIES: radical SAM family heme chaperone HemW [Asticcacaulis]|uniref:radical SAM family heme chaperone HemW n=1 Tax=Asticcacaulis TaxID=76890 RepID=UPI00285D395E|nr:radical SAM family heme chaperone HemW [Asticcacaulis sp. BE141]MBP2159826.1 oxygen-independent coproporphyrinogen-3 oxidase [Asticcacaulis solisilvae]MDR6800871.1 oxygen-independent coproporphyrinogen-3 oxidase [Asticcacaulis sp. BE141]
MISLYVHWPYCSRICPYCDFNVTRDRGQASQRTLFDAILTDLKSQAAMIGPRKLASVFFGGGTPSLLPPEWVAELITTARSLFDDGGAIEITLEANPTDAEIGRYEDFRQAGINRLSLGVQSLDDAALTFLGRNHSAAEAIRGIETAQKVFGRVSLDLIYALPQQSLAAWESELKAAIHLGIEHISPYQLTIEAATAFGRAVRRKQWAPPQDDLAEAFYFQTQETLEAHGFEAYEISNHANARAARSAHNVLIWEGIDYIGIGPGAHGRLTRDGRRHATTALSDLKAYVARIEATGTGHDIEVLSPLEAEEEATMLGLRLSDGLDLTRTPSLDLATRAAPLIADGFMAVEGNRLCATPKGRVLLDRLLMELLA